MTLEEGFNALKKIDEGKSELGVGKTQIQAIVEGKG